MVLAILFYSQSQEVGPHNTKGFGYEHKGVCSRHKVGRYPGSR